MTNSNRFINRLILALVGLVAIAAAAWIFNAAAKVITLEPVGELGATTLWVVAAVCAVLIVFSIVWMASLGRGRSRTLQSASDDDGSGAIEARVAADLIADDLARVPDIVTVSSRAFVVRGQTVLELGISTRRAADVRLVVDSVGRSVAALDQTLDSRIPVLLHVASGVRANLAREQRVR